MSIIYTEAQLSPLFGADKKPVREGWYLWTNSDEEYVQSEKAPSFKFTGTVWRYWNGVEWLWHGSAVFTKDGTDGKAMWRSAVMDPWSHWRGLKETFDYRTATMI